MGVLNDNVRCVFLALPCRVSPPDRERLRKEALDAVVCLQKRQKILLK
jgi:hypothetical protein